MGVHRMRECLRGAIHQLLQSVHVATVWSVCGGRWCTAAVVRPHSLSLRLQWAQSTPPNLVSPSWACLLHLLDNTTSCCLMPKCLFVLEPCRSFRWQKVAAVRVSWLLRVPRSCL